MITPRRLVLAALLALPGCAIDRIVEQDCLIRADVDLNAIDAFINDAQGNIERGYGIEVYDVPRVLRDECPARLPDGRAVVVACDRPFFEQRTRPVAVDLDAEARRLASLQARRPAVAAAAARAAAACR